ncbi:glycoside hydrolase [Paenibacillus nanensis]|uniref:Glycoside hydrolase n=1 Tax=Paenibacillus nanensis TaxID=393251 RepID=A0A3A1VJE6_9BACL|nr:glycoside hydrolase [Paenibacillus nanensis]
MKAYENVFSNPFPHLEEEWDDYGNGDPFVMRHNGTYYLYVSTKDFRPGIKAWQSEDLVNWSYAGLVTEDPVSTGAYAPEVVYWNGYFYLYTSPAGKGHYVYRSESPTGPFERITDNLGMSIDGSVFIDDDGSWTFTHAGTEGIVGVPMDSPSTFGFGAPIAGTFLGHWTEGSMIIKRGGTYYMTFTGNHVFSKGYRIHYAISKDSPLGPYTVPSNNPIIISTDPSFNGLGHSSTVMGPDLDSYYIVYHNLVGRSAEGPPVRQMNIDRLVFNGDMMDAVGPTNYSQPVPSRPNFEGRPGAGQGEWEERQADGGGSFTLSKTAASERYTAEYNLRITETAGADTAVGAVFAYADDSSYHLAELHPAEGRLTLVAVKNGERTVKAEAALPEAMDYSKLHAIRIENDEHGVRAYFDGMLKLEAGEAAGPGKIGYLDQHGKPDFAYTAFSNHAGGSSDFETPKALPGSIEAVHYLQGENRGFSVKEKTTDSAWRPADGTEIRLSSDGAYSVSLNNEGDWLRYVVNVSESGSYALDFVTAAGTGEKKVELLVDDRTAGTLKLNTDQPIEEDAEWVKVRAGQVELEKGFHTIAVKAKKGGLQLKRIDFALALDEPFSSEHALQDADSESVHGVWSIAEDSYAGWSLEDAKIYGGNERWADYRIETAVTLGDNPSGAAGVLLRVTNESNFKDQVKDSLMGYFVAVTPTRLELYRHNYDAELLAAEKAELPGGEPVRLRIEARGGLIQVFAGEEAKPVISYYDPDAFMQGKVGLRSIYASDITFSDLKVTSLKQK